MLRRLFMAALAVCTAAAAQAQTTPAEIAANPDFAGGVYLAYPVKAPLVTPAPEGYKPFYISHYGRHGSRYLIGDEDYTRVLDPLRWADSLGMLTPLGRDVLGRLESVWEEARGRGGELSPLGRRQHRDIARRMVQAYPEVFADRPEISAASTTVMRCAHSMFAFIEGLKDLAPEIDVDRESSNRNMWYLNYHSPESNVLTGRDGEAHREYVRFKAEKTHPERMMASIFTDPAAASELIAPADLMWGMYWIAIDMQNMESTVRFYDLFTPDELFDLWQVFNFNFYSRNSSWPKADGLHVDNAKNLLQHVVDNADRYIAEGRHGATLRFGHDGNVVPYTALLQLPGCVAYVAEPEELYKSYTDFRVSPMASNVQLVFFRNDAGDVIVKFLHNEKEVAIPYHTDIFPFYRWADARAALQHILDTPCREFIP